MDMAEENTIVRQGVGDSWLDVKGTVLSNLDSISRIRLNRTEGTKVQIIGFLLRGNIRFFRPNCSEVTAFEVEAIGEIGFKEGKKEKGISRLGFGGLLEKGIHGNVFLFWGDTLAEGIRIKGSVLNGIVSVVHLSFTDF